MPDAAADAAEYVIGVMTMQVEGRQRGRLARRVEAAAGRFGTALSGTLGVRVDLLSFDGPHLTPVPAGGGGASGGGGYEPLDFLRIGMTEKLERGVHFLLIVTEVDLAASVFSYTLALPSPLTNVAVLSTKRLDPEFWGDDPDEGRVATDLAALLLHSFGHLLNLTHEPDPANVMHGLTGAEALRDMTRFTEAQRRHMRRALPREAHERSSGDARRGTPASRSHRLRFITRMLVHNRRGIARAVYRANPLRLLGHLPTMITAALSVIIVVFFSPEIWDVASTVGLTPLLGFSLLSIVVATAVLHRGFAFRTTTVFRGRTPRTPPSPTTRRGSAAHAPAPTPARGLVIAESTVVTAAATVLCVLLTMALLFVIFAALAWVGTFTLFPRKLMETWPTVDPAVRTLDHAKLALFVAALGLLAGSLGGRADRQSLVRAVLFVDEAV